MHIYIYNFILLKGLLPFNKLSNKIIKIIIYNKYKINKIVI